MPETPDEFYQRVTADADRPDSDWTGTASWPFDGAPPVRPLEPPGAEPPREGDDGSSCVVCDELAPTVWRDDLWRVGVPPEPTGLPFAVWLMPLRHTDLAGLADADSARMGVLLARLERAATSVLHVSRFQGARWGDGAAHLHQNVFARLTVALQSRCLFTTLWDQLQPPVPLAVRDADAAVVAAKLVRTAGGSAFLR